MMIKEEKKILLKPKDAAEMLGVTTKTIDNWSKENKIFCHRTIGNHKRIPLSEVERLLLNK